jgi:hypothetical protein
MSEVRADHLELTDDEKRALIALLKRTLGLRPLPARTAPRPAESDPDEARPAEAPA